METYPALSETFIAREIEALRQRGFILDVFALQAGPGAQAIERPGGLGEWPLRALGRLSPVLQTWRWKEVGAVWWRELAPETRDGIQHIHGGFASLPAALAWGAAEEAGLPWSFSGHARDLFVKEHDLTALAGAASFATACTRAGHKALRKAAGARADAMIYAPHGLGLARYPFLFREPAVGVVPRVISVGRLVEKKGFDVLLAALALLRESGQSFSAQIVGEGPLRPALEKQVEKLGLSNSVQLTGAIDHGEVINAMQRAHCLVFAGRQSRDGDRDGLPNVLLEAAALGLPLVAAEVGAVTDLVDNGSGRLFRRNDAPALAGEITAVFAERAATEQRVRVARQRLVSGFDVSQNIEPLAAAFLRSEGTKSRL